MLYDYATDFANTSEDYYQQRGEVTDYESKSVKEIQDRILGAKCRNHAQGFLDSAVNEDIISSNMSEVSYNE